MSLRRFAPRLKAVIVLLSALALTACFDLEQHLTVKGSGAGAYEVKLRMDPAFKDALGDETLLGPQKSPVEITREVRDGQYVQEERVTFNSLSDLKLKGEQLSITNTGTSWFGLGPNTFTLIRIIENEGGDADSLGLMRQMFQDRTYRFKATMPGWLGKAHPIEIAGEKFEAKKSGSTVTWEIPMSRAISAGRLEFKIEFSAYLSVDGNVTAERTEGSLLLPR